MQKAYKFKIQWIFNISNFNGEIEPIYLQEFETFLNIIYVRSLDKILLRDKNMDIKCIYNDFLMFSAENATLRTIEYIKESVQENPNICYIEVLKK